jgi:hypothetical protein
MQSVGPKPSHEREPLASLVERATFHNAEVAFVFFASKFAVTAPAPA